MILLHGNGEDHSIFAETAEILKEHFAVYMPDTRGHGRSEGVEEYHYADMAEDLRELIRALGLERPLLCGFSDGVTPKGMKTRWYRLFQKEYQRTGDAKLKLMLREPHITAEQLARIRIPVLVTAGSRDLIRRRETERIAAGIPGSRLKILKGEDHGSYIVHCGKLAELLVDFFD